MKVRMAQKKKLAFEERFLSPRSQVGNEAKILFAQRFGCEKMVCVKMLSFTFWQDGDFWLGYLDEFPDYWTQGKSPDDLKVHLISIYRDLSSFD